MEMNSSSLDVTIRARKPYTITKQRERWTVEEHNRFLEAMKLYGRAWQRIEEHIGTKTAVQIRSHAQKFFSKLEREASAKGLQTEDAHEIKIPPPRPKRKPNNPYPRKPVFSASNVKDFPLYSALPGQVVQNIESPVEGGTETEASSISKEYLQEARPPEILALFEEAPCASPSSGSNIDNTVRGTPTLPSCGEFREFMTTESDAKDQPSMKSEINGNNIEINLEIGSLVRAESSALTIRSTSKMCEENKVHESDKLGDPELLEKGNAPSSVGYPRHVPVHVVDTGITKPLEIQSPSAITSCSDARASQYSSNTAHPPLHTAFPMHHSLNTFHTNPEALKSAAAYVSSTLSNFIIASLVENPVAHTAATIAASFWPYMTDKDACTDEVRNTDRNRTAYVEPCANLAAVAAATVSAASAWWISQGLIPICHSQFNLPSSVTPSVAHTPVTESTLCLNSDPKEERKEVDSFEPELSQVIDTTCPAPKSPLLSSESDASACGGLEGSKQIVTSDEPRKNLTSDFSEIDKTNARTQQYHSSCGSNTTSSSEREADNVHEDVKGASETLDLIHTFEVLANRRSKSTGNNNDSWKEVSDEGRLTFQALFSRDVLPQRFSQRDDIQNIEHAKSGSEEATKQESEKKETQKEKTVLIGCKSKCILTGFKPYKRCSVEANGMMISQVTEKNALKRIRTEGQAGRDAILMPVSGSSGERNFSS